MDENLNKELEELTEEVTEEAEELTEEAEEPEEPEEDPLANAFQNYAPEKKRVRWPIILLAVLIGVVFVGGLLWAFGVIRFGKKADTPDPEAVRNLTAASSEHFTVTNGMFAYYLESTYQSNAGTLAMYYGLDTSKSLKEQEAAMGGGSWFDYLVQYTQNQTEWMLLLSEKAKAEGITADDAMLAQVESSLSALDLSGYKNRVTMEDARAFLTMCATAYAAEKASGTEITDEQVAAEMAAHPLSYTTCDYLAFPISIGEGGFFASKEEAQSLVRALTAAGDKEAFRKIATDFLISTGDYDETTAASAFDGSCTFTAQSYNDNDGISEWLFDEHRAPGATTEVESDGMIAVYMLTAARHPDTTKTVDVRHILLTADTYGSDDAASKKAEEILKEWQEGDATAESFAALAKQYSEDSSSADGGMIAGITVGKTVQEFNDWCFDETRAHGDTAIVQTSYGFHVMYFETAREQWENTVRTALSDAAFEQVYTGLQKTYPITVNMDNINQLDL